MSFFPQPDDTDINSSRKRPIRIRRFLPSGIILLAMSFYIARMLMVAPAAEAKEFRTLMLRGLIVQVDRSNAQDVTFSILDMQGNTKTIHLVPSTRFLPKGSAAAQLAVNMPVIVKARTSYDGSVYAQQVQMQQPGQTALTLRGVIASINKNHRYMTLALSDGTMIQASVPARSKAQTGASVSLRGKFIAGGVFQVNNLRTLKAHVKNFQARVVVGRTNTRAHRLTLITPAGTAFAITQRQGSHGSSGGTSSALAIGARVNMGISIDSQGHLNQQRQDIVNEDAQDFTIVGMVSAIDSSNGSFTLIDEVGDTAIIKADATLLPQVQVGSYYSVDVSPETDGSLTATAITDDSIDSQDSPITLDGTVQSYDATSGLLGMVSDDGTAFSLHVSDQTTINNEVSNSTTLAIGQVIEVQAQFSADQGYSALEVDIQDDPNQGEVVTLSGRLQSYDPNSGQLTIATGDFQTVTCATTSDTQLVGAQSLSNVSYGARMLIQATMQSDGSYSATSIKVMGHTGDSGDAWHNRSR